MSSSIYFSPPFLGYYLLTALSFGRQFGQEIGRGMQAKFVGKRYQSGKILVNTSKELLLEG